MIVIDASVVLDLIIATPDAVPIMDRIVGTAGEFMAPELLDLEVLQSLRRQLRLKRIDQERAMAAVGLLAVLPIARMSHQGLAERIWQLRNNLTAYDAAYVALAEGLKAPLWTRDMKFTGTAAHQAEIVII